MKGKEAPLGAWLALGSAVAPAERPPSVAAVVGRNSELGLLRATWERVVAERRPHLVTILGPPGIGKTGLSQEFVTLVAAAGGRTLTGRSLPYGETAGYRAFAQFVKEVAGVFENDAAPLAREKLSRAVAALLPAGELRTWPPASWWTAEVTKPKRTGRVALGPGRARETRSDRSSPACSSRTSSGSGRVPRQSVPGCSALFLTLARPELLDTRPGWGGGIASSTVLDLQPLSSGDSRKLIGSLLQGRRIRSTPPARTASSPIEELAASSLNERRRSQPCRPPSRASSPPASTPCPPPSER